MVFKVILFAENSKIPQKRDGGFKNQDLSQEIFKVGMVL